MIKTPYDARFGLAITAKTAVSKKQRLDAILKNKFFTLAPLERENKNPAVTISPAAKVK